MLCPRFSREQRGPLSCDARTRVDTEIWTIIPLRYSALRRITPTDAPYSAVKRMQEAARGHSAAVWRNKDLHNLLPPRQCAHPNSRLLKDQPWYRCRLWTQRVIILAYRNRARARSYTRRSRELRKRTCRPFSLLADNARESNRIMFALDYVQLNRYWRFITMLGVGSGHEETPQWWRINVYTTWNSFLYDDVFGCKVLASATGRVFGSWWIKSRNEICASIDIRKRKYLIWEARRK